MKQASASLAENVAAKNVCGTDNVADAACALQVAIKFMQENDVASCRCHAEAITCNTKYLAAALPATS